MIPTVHEYGDHRGPGRYTLTETEHGHVWGVCVEVEGLFGEPRRGTYELSGWVSEGGEARGWAGGRLWLVPQDDAHGPWLLEDAGSLGQHARTGALVLTGPDGHEGPPEAHRSPVIQPGEGAPAVDQTASSPPGRDTKRHPSGPATCHASNDGSARQFR